MEIINKKHKDIKPFKRMDSTSYIDFYNKNEIHFSAAATSEFNLKIGKFAHFINDEDYWYFCVNDDKDGFEIKASHRRYSVAIYNGALAKLFMAKTRCSFGTKFLIRHTEADAEFNLGKLILIDINHPLEKINKNHLK